MRSACVEVPIDSDPDPCLTLILLLILADRNPIRQFHDSRWMTCFVAVFRPSRAVFRSQNLLSFSTRLPRRQPISMCHTTSTRFLVCEHWILSQHVCWLGMYILWSDSYHTYPFFTRDFSKNLTQFRNLWNGWFVLSWSSKIYCAEIKNNTQICIPTHGMLLVFQSGLHSKDNEYVRACCLRRYGLESVHSGLGRTKRDLPIATAPAKIADTMSQSGLCFAGVRTPREPADYFCANPGTIQQSC